ASLQHLSRVRSRIACSPCISHHTGSRSFFESNTPACKPVEGRGLMDELIGRLATNASIDSAVAEKTVGIILSFLHSESPSENVEALLSHIPSAETAIEVSRSGGGLSRLMGGGLMAVGTRLISPGL